MSKNPLLLDHIIGNKLVWLLIKRFLSYDYKEWKWQAEEIKYRLLLLGKTCDGDVKILDNLLLRMYNIVKKILIFTFNALIQQQYSESLDKLAY